MNTEKIKVRTETGQLLEVVVLSKRATGIQVVLGEGIHSVKCELTPTRNGLAYAGSIMGREIIYERSRDQVRVVGEGAQRRTLGLVPHQLDQRRCVRVEDWHGSALAADLVERTTQGVDVAVHLQRTRDPVSGRRQDSSFGDKAIAKMRAEERPEKIKRLTLLGRLLLGPTLRFVFSVSTPRCAQIRRCSTLLLIVPPY